MTLTYTTRPLSDRSWLGTAGHEPSRFTAKWKNTLELLGTEVGYLDGKDVVIEIDVREYDLKMDGTLRANARTPSTGAVVLAFESKHGPLLYRCDRFYGPYYSSGPNWQHNLRAIGLTLQALRAVDRYGATETGQQYTGYKALNAGRAMPPSHMTTDEAWKVIEKVLDLDFDALVEIRTPDEIATVVRRAKVVSHPDRNDGDRTLWNKVEQAAAVLLR